MCNKRRAKSFKSRKPRHWSQGRIQDFGQGGWAGISTNYWPKKKILKTSCNRLSGEEEGGLKVPNENNYLLFRRIYSPWVSPLNTQVLTWSAFSSIVVSGRMRAHPLSSHIKSTTALVTSFQWKLRILVDSYIAYPGSIPGWVKKNYLIFVGT